MASSWEIVDGKARFAWSESHSAELTPTQPHLPLRILLGDAEPWQVFAAEAKGGHALAVAESYVRNPDLITRFSQSDEDTFGFQLDHRALVGTQPEVIASLELWLSVQTAHLDSEPSLRITCEGPESQATWRRLTHEELATDSRKSLDSAGPAALISQAQGQTGVWFIEDTDQCHAAVLPSGRDSAATVEMFGHFMEKGVIRRARMQFHVVSGVASSSLLKTLYKEFCDSPLPLTA